MSFCYSTEGIAGKDRFSYWIENVCKHCIPASSSSPNQDDFEASIAGTTIGSLTAASIVSPEHTWERTKSNIRSDDYSDLWISYLDDGIAYLEQEGNVVKQSQGQLVMYDSAKPFKYNINSSKCRIVGIPRELLNYRTKQADRLTAQILGKDTGFANILMGMIKEITDNPFNDIDSSRTSKVSNSFLDLTSFVLETHINSSSNIFSTDNLYLRLVEQINHRLDDPALDLNLLSQLEHVSTRTISRVFSKHNTTAMHYIWEKRLEASYIALKEGKVRKVSEVAMNYGFCDLSHFSRTFKKHFGISPQDILHKK